MDLMLPLFFENFDQTAAGNNPPNVSNTNEVSSRFIKTSSSYNHKMVGKQVFTTSIQLEY
jgi:hypothetical protein